MKVNIKKLFVSTDVNWMEKWLIKDKSEIKKINDDLFLDFIFHIAKATLSSFQ
jgi:hypothetical protein